jgi:hypothetical protein
MPDTTPTREQVDALIKSFGTFALPGKMVRIGDVLEKIDAKVGGRNEPIRGITYTEQLIELWQDCGLPKPLQEIRDEAEWDGDQMKQSPAADLFTFLISIFND